MHHTGTCPIHTPRLLLRPFRLEDAEAMYRNWAADPLVTHYLTWPAHSNVDVTRHVVQAWAQAAGDEHTYQWCIEEKASGEPIGSISMVGGCEKAGCVEVGYCLGRAWWGKGLATEALSAVLGHFFDVVGAGRVQARCHPENLASARVMEKCGMRREGLLRQADWCNAGVCDVVYHGILAGEARFAPPTP